MRLIKSTVHEMAGNKLIKSKLLLVTLLYVFMSGCSLLNGGVKELEGTQDTAQQQDSMRTEIKSEGTNSSEAGNAEPGEAEGNRTLYQYVGNERYVNPAKEAVLRVDGDKVQVNFRNAPLADVLQVILGDMLKVPYTIEAGIKGTVTLSSSSPIAEESLFDLLESLLAAEGIALIHTAEGIFRLVPSEGLRSELPVKLMNDGSGIHGYSIRIIPLRFISVLEAQKILKPLGAEKNVIHSDPVRNLIMVAAPAPQMTNIQRTIEMFDVDVMEGMSFGIYEVFNIEVITLVERFEGMLGGAELSPIAGLVKLVPMEEINSVMVITPRIHYLNKVKDWIARLDEIQLNDDEVADTQLYVYDVENGDAEELAELIDKLFKGAISKGSTNKGGTTPGSQQKTISSADAKKAFERARNQSGSRELDLRVVPNTSNNSLLVMAEPRIWRSVKSILKKLDVVPAQVLVEVSIWEVTLDNSLRYGVEWFFENELNGGDLGVASLDLDSSGINATVPGFSYLVNDIAGGWSAVINTLDKVSRVDVLSSPSVLVLDNETAEINVGDQQPVRTGTTVTDGGTTTENIQFKDTGVRLKVSPRVNASGLVIMEIDQEVTDVGNIDAATGQRAFLRRNISSKVAIQSGDTIVLGGLIQENKSEGASGLPFISRVPLLGALFGSQTDDLKRTELLVTITPRAINQYGDFARVGKEFREKMSKVTETFDIGIK